MNIEQFKNPAYLLLVIPAISIALNEMLKKLGMNSKWCPLVNFVFGGGVSVILLFQMGFNLIFSIIIGIAIGLSAGGFFDFVKYSVLGKE